MSLIEMAMSIADELSEAYDFDDEYDYTEYDDGLEVGSQYDCSCPSFLIDPVPGSCASCQAHDRNEAILDALELEPMFEAQVTRALSGLPFLGNYSSQYHGRVKNRVDAMVDELCGEQLHAVYKEDGMYESWMRSRFTWQWEPRLQLRFVGKEAARESAELVKAKWPGLDVVYLTEEEYWKSM